MWNFPTNSLCIVYCSHLIGDSNLYVHFRLSGDKSPLLRPLRKCRYSMRTPDYPPPPHPPRTNNYTDYSLAKNCIVDIYLHFAKLCPILQFLGYAYGDICARYNQSSNLVSIWNPSIDFVKKKTWSNMHFLPLFMYGRLCWCANIPTLYCRMNTLLAFW